MAQKGGGFEREICTQLSRWWSRGDSDCIFWRTAGSGARATVRQKKNLQTANQYSDVCATDPSGQPFIDVVTLEIKRGYNSVSVAELLDPGKKRPPAKKSKKPIRKADSYAAWIDKLEQTRVAAGAATWMLIHRRDHRVAMIYMPFTFLDQLLAVGAFRNEFDKVNPYAMLRATIGGRSVEFMGIHLSDFFSGVSSDHIHAIYDKRRARRVG